jgi:hypothetical protein
MSALCAGRAGLAAVELPRASLTAEAPAKPAAPAAPADKPAPGAGAPAQSTAGPTAAKAGPATRGAQDKVVVDAKTDEAIKGAVRYLAAQQTPTGAWISTKGEHPIAITGYAIMAFLASGNLPNEGEYGKNVTAGMDFLLSCVRDDGYISSESAKIGRKASNMYDHGIGTIALAELYGTAPAPRLRQKLTSAVNLIVQCQHAAGGWRYNPRPTEGDISVSVLQVVALRAAKNSGIEVPQKTIDKGVEFIKACYDKKQGGFSYQPNQGSGPARTAAGIYSLQVCGLYDDPMVASGAAYLLKQGLKGNGEWFTYGSFYAAPAFYMIGGKQWETWYGDMNKLLLEKATTQKGDKPVVYWEGIDGNARGIGPVYCTAVYTTILAMPYHYVPLYQR